MRLPIYPLLFRGVDVDSGYDYLLSIIAASAPPERDRRRVLSSSFPAVRSCLYYACSGPKRSTLPCGAAPVAGQRGAVSEKSACCRAQTFPFKRAFPETTAVRARHGPENFDFHDTPYPQYQSIAYIVGEPDANPVL